MMTRRNTYVCTERPGAERPSLLPNGKENRYGGSTVVQVLFGEGRRGEGVPWGPGSRASAHSLAESTQVHPLPDPPENPPLLIN